MHNTRRGAAAEHNRSTAKEKKERSRELKTRIVKY